MQIEEGKYYKTRDGRKVGPMAHWPRDGVWQSRQEDRPLSHGLWNSDGTPLYKSNETHDSPTLVAEWPTGPVVTETVTKTRIVPGTYSHVTVKERHPRYENAANVSIGPQHLTADELDAAAAVLSALAKGLRDV